MAHPFIVGMHAFLSPELILFPQALQKQDRELEEQNRQQRLRLRAILEDPTESQYVSLSFYTHIFPFISCFELSLTGTHI
jgi:hypothetical protein